MKRNISLLFTLYVVCVILECMLVNGFSWNKLDRVKQTDTQNNDGNIRQKRQNGEENIVELMFYVDNSIYDTYYGYNNDPGSTDSQRRERTLEEIRTFYTNIVSGINYRYSTLSTGNVRIQIKLVDIHIQEQSNELSLQTDSAVLLSLFTAYVKRQVNGAEFPSADHYMLITNLNLRNLGNQRSAGLANQDAMCGMDSTSVVEDHFNFLNEVVFTHELAHSIGALHDGAENTCMEVDGFVMSSMTSITSNSEAQNLWRFSTCSLQSIGNFIRNINDNNRNCLSPQNTSSSPALVPQGEPLGQIYPPDEQCKRMFTSASTLTRNQYVGNYQGICTGMWCSSTILNNVLAVPADGTSCGDRKWCKYGQCVSSNSAPRKEDTCPFGDQPGAISSGNTCGQLVSGFLGRCYSEDFSFRCCGSCAARRLPITGCEYGDKNNCSRVEAINCYDEGIQTECCKTCNDLVKQDLPDSCRYGDKSNGCTPENCQTSSSTCCETCPDPNVTSSNTKLPDWVIPVIAIGSGIVIIGSIILIVCCVANGRANKTVKKLKKLDSLNNGQPQPTRPQPRRLQPGRAPPPGSVSGAYRVPSVRYAQPVRVRGEPNYATLTERPAVLYASPNGNAKPMTYSDFMTMNGGNSGPSATTVTMAPNGV